MGKRPKEVDDVNEENTVEEPKVKKQKKEKSTKNVMNGSQKNQEKKGVEPETIAENQNAGNSKKLTKKQKKKLAKLNSNNQLKESDVDKVATVSDSELEDKSENKVLKNKKSKQEKLGQKKGNAAENKNVVNGQIEKKGNSQKKNKQTEETNSEAREALSDIGQIKKKKDEIKNKNKKKVEQQDVNGSENGTVEEETEETKMDTENNELIYSLLGARPEKVSTLNAFQKRLVKMSLLCADEMDMNTSDLTKSCIEKVKQTHQKTFQGAVERGLTKGLINTILVEHTSSKSIKFEDSD